MSSGTSGEYSQLGALFGNDLQRALCSSIVTASSVLSFHENEVTYEKFNQSFIGGRIAYVR